MLKKLLLSSLVLSLSLSSANATIIFKDSNQPTLAELQAGIDACNRGDEANCKYEHYPGVVRITESGLKVGPNDPKFILANVLKPGTVLPKVEDPRALLAAIKNKKKVTIVSYRFTELKVASTVDFGEFLQDYVQHAAIPSEIVELAEQNGITPIQMYEHIATGIEIAHNEIIDDLKAQHEAIVSILTSQIDGLQAEIAGLQAAIEALGAQHEKAIASLEAKIASIESDYAVVALENIELKNTLEQAITVSQELAELNKQHKLDLAKEEEAHETTKGLLASEKEAHNLVKQALIDKQQELNNLTAALYPYSKGDPVPHDGENYDAENYASSIVELHNGDGSNNDKHPFHGLPHSPATNQSVTSILQSHSIYDEVMEQLESSIKEAYDAGYDDGYKDGYAAGYDAGYADGQASK